MDDRPYRVGTAALLEARVGEASSLVRMSL